MVTELLLEFAKTVYRIAVGALILFGVFVAIMFPYHTEPPQKISFRPEQASQDFYNLTYAEQERENKYVEIARAMAKLVKIEETIHDFVDQYHLEGARVLDVGAGSGLLQDQVADYTGLDISATARRFFHKPFVEADARAMPFKDGEVGDLWSVGVLEHVANREQALSEMRRVVKPGGIIYLGPAWLCSPFAADGYHVRPYKDFGVRGKLIKASAVLRESPPFVPSSVLPVRAIRSVYYALFRGPTAFHYWRLHPNYEKYWEPDSDAVNSMDPYEAYLWFKSRGDSCLNCGSEREIFLRSPWPLIIRVHR
jgi:SAM-dependent methyltransferase